MKDVADIGVENGTDAGDAQYAKTCKECNQRIHVKSNAINGLYLSCACGHERSVRVASVLPTEWF